MLVKYKLLVVLGLSVASLIMIASMGVKIAFSNLHALETMRDVRLKKVITIMNFGLELADLTKRSYQIVSLSQLNYDVQTEELRAMNAQLSAAIDLADKSLNEYVAIGAVRDDLKKDWDKLTSSFKSWSQQDRDVAQKIDAALKQPSEAAFSAIYAQIVNGNLKRRSVTREINDLTAEFIKANEDIANDYVNAAQSQTSSMIALLVATSVVVVAIVIAFIYSLYASVVKPIARARDVIVHVATEQDLKLRVNHASKDEIGQMASAFDRMMEKIQSSIVTVRQKVDLVNKEAASFSQVAESVAQGSQAQSSATSSMAAGIEEMSVSVSSVSDNADSAQRLAQEAGAASKQGSGAIEQTAEEMKAMVEIVAQTSGVIQALGEESRQISAIVQVIKDVADQTNLLALNAAIEAARAGDQGRGFAVVADEVRKLAERTAKSIDDITAMIKKIQASSGEAVEEMDKVVRQVEQGQKLTKEAGDQMRAIRDQAGKVSEAIDEISNALKEQSLASQDIAKNVENIAQMTDKNNEAALSASQGVKTLKKLSDEVGAELAQFKT
ncbi:MAG: methyl-accepting chemotaxis protein [Helicobacteraceae bacterium]|jgi:methyl-accepting chemotaxis protein|nr:methyl-accepting chemotaxis protein [Helicobacteraceae bacterium]